jgi:hypothetical protein
MGGCEASIAGDATNLVVARRFIILPGAPAGNALPRPVVAVSPSGAARRQYRPAT